MPEKLAHATYYHLYCLSLLHQGAAGAQQPDQHRRDDQRRPEAQAQRLPQREGRERAQHVQRPVREVHDPQHPEDRKSSPCLNSALGAPTWRYRFAAGSVPVRDSTPKDGIYLV